MLSLFMCKLKRARNVLNGLGAYCLNTGDRNWHSVLQWKDVKCPQFFVMKNSWWRSEPDVNGSRWYNTMWCVTRKFILWNERGNPISPVYFSFKYKSETALHLFAQNWKGKISRGFHLSGPNINQHELVLLWEKLNSDFSPDITDTEKQSSSLINNSKA